MDEADAYGTFNMGAGFVFYLPPAGSAAGAGGGPGGGGVDLLPAGTVEAGPGGVVLRPLGVVYEAASLQAPLSGPGAGDFLVGPLNGSHARASPRRGAREGAAPGRVSWEVRVK